MLTLLGFGLTSSGIFGCLSLIYQYIKVNNNPNLYIIESVFIRNIGICSFCLIAGISILAYVFTKSKNRSALNKLINKEKDTVEFAKCLNCGLNVAKNTKVCPKCGKVIKREIN